MVTFNRILMIITNLVFIAFVALNIMTLSKDAPTPQAPIAENPITPTTVSYSIKEAPLKPVELGIGTWSSIIPGIDASLKYLERKNEVVYKLQTPDNRNVTVSALIDTLERLKELAPQIDEDFTIFWKNFELVEVSNVFKFTGYYEPAVKVSHHKSKKYPYPIYKRPADLRDDVKYYSRKEIDGNHKLAGKGLVLAYAARLEDIFFLQIQGSGRLHFEDGTEMMVNYAGQNNHEYVASGSVFRRKNIPIAGNIQSQKDWFKANPKRITEILFENPSYVFFKEGTKGAIGACGGKLDPFTSIAADRKILPLGALVYYNVPIPDKSGTEKLLKSVGLVHDVGGAIKKNRIDIFCGLGEDAEYIAGNLNHKGRVWIILKKDIGCV